MHDGHDSMRNKKEGKKNKNKSNSHFEKKKSKARKSIIEVLADRPENFDGVAIS